MNELGKPLSDPLDLKCPVNQKSLIIDRIIVLNWALPIVDRVIFRDSLL